MTAQYIYINNKFCNAAEASLSVSDLSIQRGFGIFDFLKTINNKPIFIEDYLNRFFNSAKEMNLPVEFDRTMLQNAIKSLITKNNIPNSGIKIILTGGFSEDGYTMYKPNLIIIQTPLEISKNPFDKSISLATYNHQRQIPHVKTIDYLQAIRLQPYLKENAAEDLLYHHNGSIRECPRANFFIITADEIITPKTDILRGITRSKILSLNIPNYTILEKDFGLEDIYKAKEAFISSSTKNAFPVSAIDGKQIGDGQFNITRKIHDNLLKLIEADQKIKYIGV